MSRWFSLLLSFVLLVPLLPLPGYASAREAKLRPSVWEATAGNREADLLVVLDAQADLDALTRLEDKSARTFWARRRLWGVAARSQGPLQAWLDRRGIPYRSFYLVNALQLRGDRRLALDLAARPEVAAVTTNPWIQAQLPEPQGSAALAPDAVEWGVAKINAPQLWDLGYTGEGIVLAGQDTGYAWQHPALLAKYRGWDGQSASHDYNWHDAIHENHPKTGSGNPCGFDAVEPCDDYGHGTHTMGTMVGDDGAGNQIGVAPGAQWIGCRNMEEGWGSPASYIECFEFFLAPYPIGGGPSNGDPARAPDVVNNSWSCPAEEGCDDDVHVALIGQAVEALRAAGIMVVASAGNYGSGCSTVRTPPGMYDASYSVGATSSSDGIANFSSRGPVTVDGSGRLKPDVTAPGVNVRSSLRGGGYGSLSGTSMAAPHVAGAVALLWSADPGLRGQITRTESLLNHGAVPLYSTQCGDAAGTVPNNVYGWGRLDVAAAYLGGLSGRVRDTGGNAVPGARVEALNTQSAGNDAVAGTGGLYAMALLSGTYTVTVSASGYVSRSYAGVGVTAYQTTTLNVTLTPSCLPVAGVDFTHVPVLPEAGETVTFIGSAAAGTPPITYVWDFEDGSSPVVGNPITHTFPPSTLTVPYTTTLTAENACGQEVLRRTVTVSPGCTPVSGTSFAIDPVLPEAGETVTFTGTAAGTPPITYVWNFGDGSPPAAGNPVTHAFPSATLLTPYTTTMTATNACSQKTIRRQLSLRRFPLYLPFVLRNK